MSLLPACGACVCLSLSVSFLSCRRLWDNGVWVVAVRMSSCFVPNGASLEDCHSNLFCLVSGYFSPGEPFLPSFFFFSCSGEIAGDNPASEAEEGVEAKGDAMARGGKREGRRGERNGSKAAIFSIASAGGVLWSRPCQESPRSPACSSLLPKPLCSSTFQAFFSFSSSYPSPHPLRPLSVFSFLAFVFSIK